ncbi:hypothetical protein CYMTET_10376 [Cymbomonas tetramitiformis]|uniref:Uncharacterized protein n=1 Tax=Cymbomonas tetramitiformis TaxID=36881 RepID=A0AAE0LEI9_9CHLO|nr:hypothetical protein CYMTET_10376 [Cymbomonas tetramitiformis]
MKRVLFFLWLWNAYCVVSSGDRDFISLASGESYLGTLACGNGSHYFVTTLPSDASSLTVEIDAYTDPVSGVSSVLLEISRHSNFSEVLQNASGATSITFQHTVQSDEGDYFLRVSEGGLYCPAGYELQSKAATMGTLQPLNLTLLYQSNVRSRLMPLNKYSSMCDMEGYVEEPEACVGGADRRAGYIDSVKAKENNVVVTDTGNAIVGTYFYNLYSGEADADLLMDFTPFDIYVPQHFEFQAGEATLSQMLDFLEKAVVVLSNVDYSDTILALSSQVERYVVKEFEGRFVGLLGFIDEDIKELAPLLSENFIVNPSQSAQDSQGSVASRTAAELSLTIAALQESFPYCNIFIAVGPTSTLCEEMLKLSSSIAVCIASSHEESTDWDSDIDCPYRVVQNAMGNSTLVLTGHTSWYGRRMGNLWGHFASDGMIESWEGVIETIDEALNVSNAEASSLLNYWYTESEEDRTEVVGSVATTVSGKEGVPLDNATWPGCRAHDCQMGRFITDALLDHCTTQFDTTCDVAVDNGRCPHAAISAVQRIWRMPSSRPCSASVSLTCPRQRPSRILGQYYSVAGCVLLSYADARW